MESPDLKMKYKDLSGFEFSNLMQRLSAHPTEGKHASHIRQITKRLNAIRSSMSDEYKKEVMEHFSLKDEKGEFLKPENPQGPQDMYQVDPAKMEDYQKAVEAFGEKEGVIDWRPFTPSTLKDFKISGREIELLGVLYTEEDGPGVPRNFSVVGQT